MSTYNTPQGNPPEPQSSGPSDTPSQQSTPGYGQPPQYGQQAPQYGQPAPQYGQPTAPYGAAPAYAYGGLREHPQGTLILILGIVGIVAIQLCAPFAWVMGRKALREIDANPGAYSNRGQVQAGYIMGIIGTVLLALVVVLVIIWIIVVIAAIGASSTS